MLWTDLDGPEAEADVRRMMALPGVVSSVRSGPDPVQPVSAVVDELDPEPVDGQRIRRLDYLSRSISPTVLPSDRTLIPQLMEFRLGCVTRADLERIWAEEGAGGL